MDIVQNPLIFCRSYECTWVTLPSTFLRFGPRATNTTLEPGTVRKKEFVLASGHVFGTNSNRKRTGTRHRHPPSGRRGACSHHLRAGGKVRRGGAGGPPLQVTKRRYVSFNVQIKRRSGVEVDRKGRQQRRIVRKQGKLARTNSSNHKRQFGPQSEPTISSRDKKTIPCHGKNIVRVREGVHPVRIRSRSRRRERL